MTKEDKELLLKDLSARLPYGVICNLYDPEDENKKFQLKELSNLIISAVNSGCIKPYLRPMSSMTNEEFTRYDETRGWRYVGDDRYESIDTFETFDWLDAHHFDYRGLIEKGLALEAPENMYKI